MHTPLLWSLPALMLLAGCKHNDAELGTDRPIGRVVSFREDVAPILGTRCALSGCHDSGTMQQGMDLSNPFDPVVGAVDVFSTEVLGALRIKSGNAAASYLVAKIEGRQSAFGGGGERMPYGGPYLSRDEIDTIKQWIDDGAKND